MKQGYFTLNHLINNIYTTHALRTVIHQEFDIGLTEYCILLELAKKGGSGSPHELAQQLNITPSAVTLCLNRLEATQMALRQLREDDARKVDVILSSFAETRLPQIDRLVVQTIGEIWQPLNRMQIELLLRGSVAIVSERRNVRLHLGKVRADTVYAEAVIITFMRLSAIAKQQGLTLNEFSVLFALAKKRQPIGAMAAANMLLMRQNTMTATVKTLEQKGFVESICSNADKRVHMLSITPIGNECFFTAYRPMSEATRQRVGNLNDQELKEFKAIGDIFIEAERRRRALA